MRVRPLLPMVLSLALTLLLGASCSNSAKDAALRGTPTSAPVSVEASSPNATGPSAGTAAASSGLIEPDSSEVSPGVSSQIIDTPNQLLAANPPGYLPNPAEYSIVAEAVVPRIDVYTDWDSATPFTVLANPLPSGSKLTFLTEGQTPVRAKVLVPIHPPDEAATNEVIGWIPLSQVATKRNAYRVVISLAAHQLTVFRGNNTIMTVPVGIGTEATPTPGGRYYIKELIKPLNSKTKKYDPTGVYGPYAYGLSGYSKIYDADNPFNGGDGQLGIHGTNQPELIGTNVSNGCIRVTNENIVKMRQLLPLGTPVVIRP